ncbi:hypothetical protein L6475_04950 [Prevotella sp. E9-3]|uniref:hypothetical protein n=1 Tax=Prevotella sp. E9-3 TaxID=2913621 RepID=UPI001EDB573E|nr:hypothetical protein [Prevotella sp. E9-3]UKK49302.1 hypothetical protein L6475_04950 [Prevotella sp. E9-3]
METTEQTLQQIDRAIRKIADKFPAQHEATQLTDIHICVSQDTGELTAFDDDDNEITRCVIEQWIDEKSDDFYEQAASVLRQSLQAQSELVESMSVLKPFAFVLENDEKDEQHELYVVDDDTIIIDPIMMDNLDEDLNTFFENLMKDC